LRGSCRLALLLCNAAAWVEQHPHARHAALLCTLMHSYALLRCALRDPAGADRTSMRQPVSSAAAGGSMNAAAQPQGAGHPSCLHTQDTHTHTECSLCQPQTSSRAHAATARIGCMQGPWTRDRGAMRLRKDDRAPYALSWTRLHMTAAGQAQGLGAHMCPLLRDTLQCAWDPKEGTAVITKQRHSAQSPPSLGCTLSARCWTPQHIVLQAPA